MVITALLNVYCPSAVYFVYLPDFEVQFWGRSFPEISAKNLIVDTRVFFHSVMKLNKQKYMIFSFKAIAISLYYLKSHKNVAKSNYPRILKKITVVILTELSGLDSQKYTI